MAPSPAFSVSTATHRFDWDLVSDRASLRRSSGDEIWSGSLLPLFWLTDRHGRAGTLKPTVNAASSRIHDTDAELAIELGSLARGRLVVSSFSNTLKLERLELTWTDSPPPAINALYFGASVLTPAERTAVPTLDLPFWPDWRAEGFAVASAKTNPMQSFFRSWDFGHTNIALGSFGPAMGTPYSAAFPRPTYAACAGGRHGWICFGAGSVPDAALTFQVRARSGAIEWRYREDLWGTGGSATRVWENPLWFCWGDDAWTAYRDYFRLFPAIEKPASHQKTFWGTWGDFRLNEFEWRSSIDRAVDQMEADLICIDDPWESLKGSCRPHPRRLPTFDADVARAHQRQLGLGIWMPIVWIEDYAAEGLTIDDVLLNRDGQPVRSNWAVDPRDPQAYFCLDPSSANARRFLRERTRRVMHDYRPRLLKIDFGYGVPGPDACAPRDPACRGERLAWTLAQVIAEAAREIDETVTVLGYSLHPLWAGVQDQVSLDDLGDAGMHEAAGHGQWSVWAALAGDRGVALMGSSGYLWEADADVVMNSAILGAPGANLPRTLPDGSPLPAERLARRRAVFRWHRRTTKWHPLWLDSAPGDLRTEPATRNWGRLEPIGQTLALTALALRDPSPSALAASELRGLTWTGRWILIAQENASVFTAPELALIPIAAGTLSLPRAHSPRDVRLVFGSFDEPYDRWRWADGMLHLEVDASVVAQPVLGLLLRN